MRRNKVLLTLLLAVCMVMTVACTGPAAGGTTAAAPTTTAAATTAAATSADGTTAAATTAAATTAATTAAAAEQAPAGEGGTLSLWTWKVAMTPGFEAAGELFAAETGYDLTVEAFTPDDTYRQKVIAAANSGDLPDLIHWWATRGAGFENVLVNMTDVYKDEAYVSKFSETAFNNSLVRANDVNNWANDAEKSDVVKALKEGDLYQIPVDMGGFFTIYGNNSILAEVGLDNKVPADYDEFIQFASQVATETDYGGFIWAAGLPDVYYNWMGRAVENTFLGPEVSVDIINRRAKMSDPKNILPLKKFEELAKSGAFMDGIATMTIDDGDMAFAAGQAGYLLGGTFTYGQLSAMGMDLNNVFSFVVPMMKESAVTDPYTINGFTLTAMSVPQSSQYQEAAMDYINFIATDPEGVAAFCNGAYVIPVAALDEAGTAMLSPAIQNMYNSLSDEINVTTEVDNWPDSIGKKLEYEELYKDMQRILLGEITAEEAAANFDANAAAQAAAGQ